MKTVSKRGFFGFLAGLPFVGPATAAQTPPRWERSPKFAPKDGSWFLVRDRSRIDGSFVYGVVRYDPMPERLPAARYGEMPWRLSQGAWINGFDEWMPIPHHEISAA